MVSQVHTVLIHRCIHINAIKLFLLTIARMITKRDDEVMETNNFLHLSKNIFHRRDKNVDKELYMVVPIKIYKRVFPILQ